jgi:hypothetical protein
MMSTNSADSSWSRLLFSAGIFLLGGGVFLIGVALTISVSVMVLFGGVVASSLGNAEPVMVAVPPNQGQPDGSMATYPTVTYQPAPYAAPDVPPEPYDNQPTRITPADVMPAPGNLAPLLEPAPGRASPENSAPRESPE